LVGRLLPLVGRLALVWRLAVVPWRRLAHVVPSKAALRAALSA
jgi:hypothetical protein